MTTDVAAAQELFDRSKAGAQLAYNQYILTRTPAYLQESMATIMAANAPLPPLTATQVILNSGASVPVVDAASAPVAGSPGAATIAGGVLANVKLTV